MNLFDYLVHGEFGLFTDPMTKLGGEKSTYHLPTYEALKGITRNIYWKPTIIWHIDKVRLINPIRTASKGMTPYSEKNKSHTLCVYTYLFKPVYQVRCHFEWNLLRDDLKDDRNVNKHVECMRRAIDKGGRMPVFIGTSECGALIEPCVFGDGAGFYDNAGELDYSLMFHSYSYPEESGNDWLDKAFWRPKVVNGVIDFVQHEHCPVFHKNVIKLNSNCVKASIEG